MSGTYSYSEYNNFNRFSNLDGLEAKLIEHLITSTSEYAEKIWKLLKYDTKDALAKDKLTEAEKRALLDGNQSVVEGQNTIARVFMQPFIDDAWTQECASLYVYLDDVYPVDQARSDISIVFEPVVHSKVNMIFGDADTLCNPDNTNPNDYYYTNDITPTVQFKSRVTVLLKCLLAEFNGLYVDGVGYVQFNASATNEGGKVKGKASLCLYNGRSYFGHKVELTVTVSGISENPDYGF